MKQQKLTEYRPRYPQRALRGAALTAATLMAMGGMAGCVKAKVPGVELQTEGVVAVTEPPEEELVLDGEVAIPEVEDEPVFQGKIAVTEPPEEELVLDGEVAIPEPEQTPDPQELTTTGMVYVPEGDGR